MRVIFIVILFITGIEMGYMQNVPHSVQPISVNCAEISREVELMSFFKVDMVPLETNKNCLIQQIEKVVATENHFVVWDKIQKTILVFKKNGAFVAKKTSVSHAGPGEFTFLFDIDAVKDTLFLLSDNKIFLYDFNLKHLNTIKLVKFYDKFQISDGWVYGYNPSQTPIDREKVGAFNLANPGKSYPLLYEKRELGWFRLVVPFNFCSYSGEILFSYLLTDTIYSLQKNRAYPKYVLTFGTRKFATHAFDKIPPNDPYAGMNMFNALRETKFAYSPTRFVENDLGISFRIGLEKNNLFFFQNPTKTIHFLSEKCLLDGREFPAILIGFTPSYHIYCANPWDLTPKLKERIKSKGYEITDDSNPILLILSSL